MKQRNMTSIYLRYQNKILMLYREGSRVANHLWISSAGGHMENEELNDAQSCILRELEEELHLKVEDLVNFQMKYVTLRHTNDEIRVIYYFFAEVADLVEIVSNEGKLQWFSLEEINDLPMPITAKKMLEHYIAVGQFDSQLYAGIMKNQDMTVSPLL
ncbi:NUDIX domain-containing protein [Streptococcus sp. S784/96/1]|uniref:NUDIX domain-containing protein n=1 Tax=Streptococcus sp. S784/96/1 TaxID=2653499 RepID=UPI0013871FCE|nr:NUDIX domain-containing protein [Streptococcus sp. S784/96/1]